MIASVQIAAARIDPENASAASSESSKGSDEATHQNFRAMLHHYHSSYKHNSEEDSGSHKENPKDSDPTQIAAAIVNVTEPSPLRTLAPLTSSITVWQDGTALHNHSAVARDAKEIAEADAAAPASAVSNKIDDSASPLRGDQLAFAARLRISASDQPAGSQANISTADPNLPPPPQIDAQTGEKPIASEDSPALNNSPADKDRSARGPSSEVFAIPDGRPATGDPIRDGAAAKSRPQVQFPVHSQPAAKQIAPGAGSPADPNSGGDKDQSSKEQLLKDQSFKGRASDLFVQHGVLTPIVNAPQVERVYASIQNDAPSQEAPMARLEKVIDPPTSASASNRDITVRLPDATNQGTAVRFVERAGEVHVSVRTGDAEMAQTLRGGLHDLVNRLEDGGIRTEVWQPDASPSFSQNDSHHPFADADGSNGGKDSSGSNSDRETGGQNRPRWVEELEGSIGNQNSKETTQLLWQA